MIEDERDIDLFAGPGGWDEGATGLGVRPLGIEWDAAACATRRARGHETLQADVSQLDPAEFAPVRLMIASAPCQAFSMAGLGQARNALEAYVAEIRSMMAGNPIDRERLDAACSDERGHLVLEPLRWALAVRPRFIACEQVEPVLPLWEAMATALRELGYGTWTGLLSAEQYGVPQTRRRAFLLAKLDGEVTPPPATHQRYIAPRVKAKQDESLFDAPEPERIVAPEDRELLPWVSMAEALGWGMTARPFPVVANHHADGGMDYSCVGGSQARQRIYDERDAGRWAMRASVSENGSEKSRDRTPDEPAQTVTSKHRSAEWVADPPTHMNTGRDWKPGGSREDAQKIPTSEPSPAFTGKLGGQAQWVSDRPATTVAGDPRVFPPGHKLNDDDVRAGRGGQLRSGSGRVVQHRRGGERLEEEWSADRPSDAVTSRVDRWQVSEPDGQGAVRVTVQEAAVLQGFPPDYPWQGTRTAQYRQIGDAVPPPWARAILAHLLA